MPISCLCFHAAPYFSCHHHWFCLHILHVVPVLFSIVIPTSFNINVFHTSHVYASRQWWHTIVTPPITFYYGVTHTCTYTLIAVCHHPACIYIRILQLVLHFLALFQHFNGDVGREWCTLHIRPYTLYYCIDASLLLHFVALPSKGKGAISCKNQGEYLYQY